VHWPFCQAKCPYCDFNSHVRTDVDQSVWRVALVDEIHRQAGEFPCEPAGSLFFGGGTPSLMEPQTVSAVIEAVASRWGFCEAPEITLEANPTSVEAAKFADFRAAGVNRVSMGVQSLRDEDLKRLGRLHSAVEAKRAFGVARKAFDRVSFDLIYARQHQSLTDWEVELSEATDLAVDHLSLYQLTIEPQTAFGARFDAGKLKGLPADSLAADMYLRTNELMAGAGYESYEVSNYSKPGQTCAHNLVYWQGGAYAGIGPGAHGRLLRNGTWYASDTELAPEAWLAAPQARTERLSDDDRRTEYLMMALRLSSGAELARLEGLELNEGNLRDLIDMGFLRRTNSHLMATSTGRTVLNTVLKELLV